MTDSAINKESKCAIWIPLLVLITLAACAIAGYSHWRMQQQPSVSVKVEPPPSSVPVFFALDTFTINLGDVDRALHIGITLCMKDEVTRSRLNEYLPEVRSRLLLLLSRQNAAILVTEEGKQQLVTAIKEALATSFVVGRSKQVVTDVLYTVFILR